MKKYLILIFATFVSLSSCIDKDDIRIASVDKVSLKSLTKPEITVTVENDSNRKVQVKQGRFVLSKNGSEFLNVILVDKIVIPKCSEVTIDLPLRMKASNPLTVMSVIAGWKSKAEGITVTGEAVLKAGMAKKKFKFKDVPVSQILSIFEVE